MSEVDNGSNGLTNKESIEQSNNETINSVNQLIPQNNQSTKQDEKLVKVKSLENGTFEASIVPSMGGRRRRNRTAKINQQQQQQNQEGGKRRKNAKKSLKKMTKKELIKMVKAMK